MAADEVIRVHRGVYCLASRYLDVSPNPLALAQRICGPSYISLETALSWHGWIPEAVHAVTSVCLGRSREFSTPLGHFTFTRVPQRTLYLATARVETEAGESFLIASPLKALADYIYIHRPDWASARDAFASLRIEGDALDETDPSDVKALASNYSSRRVRAFLASLKECLRP